MTTSGQYSLRDAINHTVLYLNDFDLDIDRRDVQDVIKTLVILAGKMIEPGKRIHTIKALDEYFPRMQYEELENIMEGEYDYLKSLGLVLGEPLIKSNK